MDLIVATNNLHKLKEIRKILGNSFENIYSLKEKNIFIDIPENGTTFSENAEIKARAIFAMTNVPTIADDSGLCVDSLGGAPGIFSARYAGISGGHAIDFENNNLLLKNLNGQTERGAYFECAIVLVTADKTYFSSGKTYGRILAAAEGTNGFGYDPIFYSDELDKSFGNATEEEKNAISHRGKALDEMKWQISKDGLI